MSSLLLLYMLNKWFGTRWRITAVHLYKNRTLIKLDQLL